MINHLRRDVCFMAGVLTGILITEAFLSVKQLITNFSDVGEDVASTLLHGSVGSASHSHTQAGSTPDACTTHAVPSGVLCIVHLLARQITTPGMFYFLEYIGPSGPVRVPFGLDDGGAVDAYVIDNILTYRIGKALTRGGSTRVVAWEKESLQAEDVGDDALPETCFRVADWEHVRFDEAY